MIFAPELLLPVLTPRSLIKSSDESSLTMTEMPKQSRAINPLRKLKKTRKMKRKTRKARS